MRVAVLAETDIEPKPSCTKASIALAQLLDPGPMSSGFAGAGRVVESQADLEHAQRVARDGLKAHAGDKRHEVERLLT